MTRKKISLIEDDSSMVGLLKALLEIEGYQVDFPPLNSSHLVRSIIRENPDLILLDVFLGKLDGLDFLIKLKENELLKSKKVLMTSGTNLEENCIKAGADGFILKPFMPDELITTMKKFLDE